MTFFKPSVKMKIEEIYFISCLVTTATVIWPYNIITFTLKDLRGTLKCERKIANKAALTMRLLMYISL